MPPPPALVAQRGEASRECKLICMDANEGGLSPAQERLTLPPYAIANGLIGEPLNTHSISVLAERGAGLNTSALEYNAHSLYGMTMARATFVAAAAITKERPFVVFRCVDCAGGCGGPGKSRFSRVSAAVPLRRRPPTTHPMLLSTAEPRSWGRAPLARTLWAAATRAGAAWRTASPRCWHRAWPACP